MEGHQHQEQEGAPHDDNEHEGGVLPEQNSLRHLLTYTQRVL